MIIYGVNFLERLPFYNVLVGPAVVLPSSTRWRPSNIAPPVSLQEDLHGSSFMISTTQDRSFNLVDYNAALRKTEHLMRIFI